MKRVGLLTLAVLCLVTCVSGDSQTCNGVSGTSCSAVKGQSTTITLTYTQDTPVGGTWVITAGSTNLATCHSGGVCVPATRTENGVTYSMSAAVSTTAVYSLSYTSACSGEIQFSWTNIGSATPVIFTVGCESSSVDFQTCNGLSGTSCSAVKGQPTSIWLTYIQGNPVGGTWVITSGSTTITSCAASGVCLDSTKTVGGVDYTMSATVSTYAEYSLRYSSACSNEIQFSWTNIGSSTSVTFTVGCEFLDGTQTCNGASGTTCSVTKGQNTTVTLAYSQDIPVGGTWVITSGSTSLATCSVGGNCLPATRTVNDVVYSMSATVSSTAEYSLRYTSACSNEIQFNWTNSGSSDSATIYTVECEGFQTFYNMEINARLAGIVIPEKSEYNVGEVINNFKKRPDVIITPNSG